MNQKLADIIYLISVPLPVGTFLVLFTRWGLAGARGKLVVRKYIDFRARRSMQIKEGKLEWNLLTTLATPMKMPF